MESAIRALQADVSTVSANVATQTRITNANEDTVVARVKGQVMEALQQDLTKLYSSIDRNMGERLDVVSQTLRSRHLKNEKAVDALQVSWTSRAVVARSAVVPLHLC